MELIRRMILVAGLLIGLWQCFWATPHLFRVDPVDWEKHRQHKERSAEQLKQMASDTLGRDVSGEMEVYTETRLNRESYIAHETKGRTTTVEGAKWDGFFMGVSETVLGRPPSSTWQKRKARRPSNESLYFRIDEAPLTTLVPGLRESDPIQFVRIKGRNRSEFLLIHIEKRSDFAFHAPAFLIFPHRTAGLALILAACLLYSLLPRRSSNRDGVTAPPARPTRLSVLFRAVLCAIPASLLAITWPPADPSIPAGRLQEKAPVVATTEPVNSVMLETINQEEAILEDLKTIQIKIESVSARMKDATPTERKALEKESDQYLAEVERLQRLFEKVSKSNPDQPSK